MTTTDLLNKSLVEASKKGYRKLHRSLSVARPFMFDIEATKLVEELSQGAVNNERNLVLARLPFDKVWLELDLSYDEEADENGSGIGFLLQKTGETSYSVTTITSGIPYGDFQEWNTDSVIFNIDTEQDVLITEEKYRTDQVGIIKKSSWGVKELSSILSSRVSLEFNEESELYNLNEADKSIGVKAIPNGLKILTIALAVLNEVPVIFTPSKVSGSYRAFQAVKPFMSHNIVTIDIPASRPRNIKTINRYLAHAERIRKRAHEVRGHWRIYNRGSSSEYRTWIKSHVRGDASLGWVNQTHLVTTTL